MCYSDEELAALHLETDSSDVQDKSEDIRPWHSKTDPEEEFVEINSSVRRASALALDNLTLFFKKPLLQVLLPEIQKRFSDSQWKIRETAILALGAIALGCINELTPHLPKLLKYLFKLMDDHHPTIRSISCWTTSRFTSWLLQDKQDQK
eukprot:UN30941